MTSTLQTTWTQIFHETWEEAFYDNSGTLTEDQQEAVNDYARAKVDRILAPYGCFITGNGEIIRSDIEDDSVLEWDEDEIKDALGMIDCTTVYDTFE